MNESAVPLSTETAYSVIKNIYVNGTNNKTLLPNDMLGRVGGIDDLPRWPPDLFAGMALLLERSGAYTHPAFYDVDKLIACGSRTLEVSAEETRTKWINYALTWKRNDHAVYFELDQMWKLLLQESKSPLDERVGRRPEPPEWAQIAFILLHIADMACAGVGKDDFPAQVYDWPRTRVYANQQKAYFDEHVKRQNRVAEISDIERDYDDVTEIFRDRLKCSELLPDPFESLCDIIPTTIACVQAKSLTPQVGQTIHSFSHNLALLPPKRIVATSWFNTFPSGTNDENPGAMKSPRGLNLLVVPYPYQVAIQAFKPDADPTTRRFRIDPNAWLGALSDTEDGKCHHLTSGLSELVTKALDEVGRIDGIILPELALTHRLADRVSGELFRKFRSDRDKGNDGIGLFVSGVSAKRLLQDFDSEGKLVAIKYKSKKEERYQPRAANAVYTRVRLQWHGTENKVTEVNFRRLQVKHHRWRLDSRQLERYNLSSKLSIDRLIKLEALDKVAGGSPAAFEVVSSIEPEWREDTDIIERECLFWAIRNGYVISTMVCEDLARVEPVHQVLRAVGPNLLIAVLMDGPQYKWRWAGRYAMGLCDDPGTSVLIVTSLGMVRRSQHLHDPPCRNIALWQDPFGDIKELVLPDKCGGIVLSLAEQQIQEITASGRHQRQDEISKKLILKGVRGVRAPTDKKMFATL